MVTILAPAVTDPKPLTPSRIGLLASAAPLGDIRWQGGVSYRPILGPAPVANSTFYPCTGSPDVNLETVDAVSWEAWGIGLGQACLSGSTDEDEESRRAQSRLQTQTEYLTSRTFWTGELDGSTFGALGLPNRPLADLDSDDLTTTGPVGIVTGFSRAIEYLADQLGSQRGMIHVEPALAPFLSFYGVAIRDGFQVLTALADHIVVIGAGYDGSSPNGEPAGAGTSWIYATSIVRAAVSNIQLLPYLNRTNNQWEARATRSVIAEWDLQAHGAVQVCIPDPGPSCLEIPS